MTRGRRPDMTLEPSRQLQTARAFRERRAAHLKQLEETVANQADEIVQLKKRLGIEVSAKDEEDTKAVLNGSVGSSSSPEQHGTMKRAKTEQDSKDSTPGSSKWCDQCEALSKQVAILRDELSAATSTSQHMRPPHPKESSPHDAVPAKPMAGNASTAGFAYRPVLNQQHRVPLRYHDLEYSAQRLAPQMSSSWLSPHNGETKRHSAGVDRPRASNTPDSSAPGPDRHWSNTSQPPPSSNACGSYGAYVHCGPRQAHQLPPPHLLPPAQSLYSTSSDRYSGPPSRAQVSEDHMCHAPLGGRQAGKVGESNFPSSCSSAPNLSKGTSCVPKSSGQSGVASNGTHEPQGAQSPSAQPQTMKDEEQCCLGLFECDERGRIVVP